MDEAQAQARVRRRISCLDGSSAIELDSRYKNSAYEWLMHRPGKTLADTLERAFDPWGQERFPDLAAIDPDAAMFFAQSLTKLRDQMQRWDKKTSSKYCVQASAKDHSLEKHGDRHATSNYTLIECFQHRSYSNRLHKDTAASSIRMGESCCHAIPAKSAERTAHGPTIDFTTSLKDLTSENFEELVAPMCTNPNPSEAVRKQARVVYIRGCKKGTQLKDITAHITESAVMSLFIEEEEDSSYPPLSACIMFMDYKHAAEFMGKNAREAGRSGKALYGKEIVQGGPWAEDDEIRSMAPPR
ncbi:hypothetical protein MMC27_008715 [Xylographa pallens]|nr:hypothetical protein [Xylographa pallens]